MPPKKKGERSKAKGGAKKIASGKAQTTIDGVPVKNMTKDQLEGHVIRLRNEIDREREERGFIQSELERVQRLWSVTSRSLEEARTSLRLKDSEMAEAERARLTELRANRQQTKAVTDEREYSIGKLQIQSEETLLSLQKEHLKEKSLLANERETLRAKLREANASFLSLFANIKVNHSRDLEELRNSFEAEWRQSEEQHNDRIQMLQADLDLKRKSELSKQNEEKNAFLAKVISSHEEEIEIIKKQSAEVTNANLRLITQLRAQLAEQRNETIKNTQQTAKEEKQKNSLKTELAQAKKQLLECQRLLQRSKHLEIKLKTAETTLKRAEKDKEILKSELETLIIDAKQIEKERDELYAQFIAVVADVHQRSQMKTTLLEKRLSELSKQLEKRETVLSEVLKAANLDSKSFGALSNQLESIVEEKNNLVASLQEEVATMRRMYVELLEKRPPSSGTTQGGGYQAPL